MGLAQRASQSSWRRAARPTIVAVSVCVALAACPARIDSRGNQPDPDRLAEITAGEHNRDDVAEILGSPSSIAMFGDETWYYVSKRTETLAFLAPEVTERQVVIVRFDRQGVVKAVDYLDLDDEREIQFVERETPTSGNEIGLLDQLLGNIGRFGGEGDQGSQ